MLKQVLRLVCQYLHLNGLEKMATGYFSDLNSLHSGLSLQISVKLLLDIRQDWSPASSAGFKGFLGYKDGNWLKVNASLRVVNSVAISRRVDNSESETDSVLFKHALVGFHLHQEHQKQQQQEQEQPSHQYQQQQSN